MATTRAKKTIRLNPLVVDTKSAPPRSGLLSDSPVAARTGTAKTKSVAARPEKTKAKPSVKGTGKAVAKKTSKADIKSIKQVKPASPEKAVAASGVLEEKKKSVKTPRNKSKDVVANAAPAVSASQEYGRSNEGQAEVVAVPVLRNRPVAQVRYGDVLSVREIVPGPQSDEFGFYEPNGEFVSLMHLEGPVDRSRSGFFPLAVAGLVMGGGLGFVTASILNIRKNTIFLARQLNGQHKYVSLDWNGLSHLKRMAFKLGR
jgi:hypothetical protein